MKVYPVVHINHDPSVAPVQANKAFELGADGIYLIDHMDVDPSILFHTFNQINKDHSDDFIGVNMLGYRPSGALVTIERALEDGELDRAPDALWTDDIKNDAQVGDAMSLKEYLTAARRVRLLGGVAFKYTRSFTEEPQAAAQEAIRMRPHVDTVVTSGAGTGLPPSVAKIRAMKNALGDEPLAVASGISLLNMHRFAGLVDEVLVASSVETEPYSGEFDEAKLKAFIDKAHALGK